MAGVCGWWTAAARLSVCFSKYACVCMMCVLVCVCVSVEHVCVSACAVCVCVFQSSDQLIDGALM